MPGTIPLKTERLTLRRHIPEDAAVLHRDFGADEAMFHYTGWNPYATPAQAEKAVAEFISRYDDPRFYGWAIQREGRLIGTIGAYDYDPEKNQIEIGYSIARAHWGHGYAAEALRAALQYLTEEGGVARVTAWCAPENIASRRTLEKAGFQLKSQTLDRLDFIYESILSSAGAV